MTHYVAAQLPAAGFTFSELQSQLQVIFMLILFGLAAYALYLGFSHKLGKVATVICICFLAMLILGIAAGGPGGVSNIATKMASFIG